MSPEDAVLYSTLAGYFATASVASYLPQVLRNARLKVVNNVSLALLVVWLASDIFCLLACILEGLLFTSKLMYALHGVLTIVLIVQVVYYTRWPGGRTFRSRPDLVRLESGPSSAFPTPGASAISLPQLAYADSPATTPATEKGNPLAMTPASELGNPFDSPTRAAVALPSSPRTPMTMQATTGRRGGPAWSKRVDLLQLGEAAILLLGLSIPVLLWAFLIYVKRHSADQAAPVASVIQPVGFAFGWIGAILSAGGYLPQLVKNFRLKSVEGLSFAMFLLIAAGQIGNILAIVLRDTSRDYLITQSPVLATSCAGVFLSGILFAQWLAYRKAKPPSY